MDYQVLLKNCKLKVTPQRIGILSLMFQAGHITIEELYKNIKAQFASISLATLYKNINAMLEKNLITEVKVPNSKNMYEITKDEHAHLLCKSCHTFIDIKINSMPIIEEASEKSHFKIEHSDIILSGLCPECA